MCIVHVCWVDVARLRHFIWLDATFMWHAGYKLSRLVLKAIARRYGGKEGKLAFNEFALAVTKVVSLVGMFL